MKIPIQILPIELIPTNNEERTVGGRAVQRLPIQILPIELIPTNNEERLLAWRQRKVLAAHGFKPRVVLYT